MYQILNFIWDRVNYIMQEGLKTLIRNYNRAQEQKTNQSLSMPTLADPNYQQRRQIGTTTQDQQTITNQQLFHQFIKKQNEKYENHIIPLPPRTLSISERIESQLVNKYKKKYQFLWILVVPINHVGRQAFKTIFQEQYAPNLKGTFQNIYSKDQINKIKIFIKGGLDIKLLSDYESGSELMSLQNEGKVLSIHIEEGKKGDTYRPSRKVKYEKSIQQFIEETVVREVQQSRKNVPYHNFIHFDSSPEVFNRRNLIQNALIKRPFSEIVQNHENFMIMLKQSLDQWYENQFQKIIKGKVHKTDELKNKKKTQQDLHNKFNEQFKQIINSNIQNQFSRNQKQRQKIADLIITYYGFQTQIYPLLNNTIRHSLNIQKIKPISQYLRYLHQSIRFYFNKHSEAPLKKLYRGSTFSMEQQRKLYEGQYLWNLGFLSVSRDQDLAKNFIPRQNKQKDQNSSKMIQYTQEGVLMEIQVPEQVRNKENLQNQQGYCLVDKITNTQKILSGEKQILFNPLNIFKVKEWRNNENPKVLRLTYSPQIELLEKRRKGQELQENDKRLLRNIGRVKVDKGQELLQSGKPSESNRYYEQSLQNGESLSIQQMGILLQSKQKCGKFHEIQQSLEKELEREQKQLQNLEESSLQLIQKSLQVEYSFHSVEDYHKAYERSQKTQKMIQSKVKTVTTPQSMALEIKSYLTTSIIRLDFNESKISIISCLKALKVIDEIPNINYYDNLVKYKQIMKKIKLPQMYKFWNVINKQYQPYSSMDLHKKQTMKRLQKVREGVILGQQFDMKEYDRFIEKYLEERKSNKKIISTNQHFIKAYFEIVENSSYNFQGQEKELIQKGKETVKELKKYFLKLKNSFFHVMELQMQILLILYKNILKTSISSRPFLTYYKEIFFLKYDSFLKRQETVLKTIKLERIKMLKESGYIILDYERVVKLDDSEGEGKRILKEASELLKLKQEDMPEEEKETLHIYEKTEINTALNEHYMSYVLDKHKEYKMATSQIKSMQNSRLSMTPEKAYQQVIDNIDQNIKMYQSDESINISYYTLQENTTKIELINGSKDVKLQNSSFQSRLKHCKSLYNQTIECLQNHEKQKKYLQKTIKMAKLNYLMAQNYLRLGITYDCDELLEKAKTKLRKALKLEDIDERNFNEKDKKLFYGNSITIECLKIQSFLKNLKKDKKQIKEQLQKLIFIKDFVERSINEPLLQATLKENIGQSYCILFMIYKQPSLFVDIQNSEKQFGQAIQLRKNYLGKDNKYNARSYYYLIWLTILKGGSDFKEIKNLYNEANNIYLNIKTTDPTQKLHELQLKAMYLKYKDQKRQRIEVYDKAFTQYMNDCNKVLSYPIARKMAIFGCQLLFDPEFKNIGLKWLQKSIQNYQQLEYNHRPYYQKQMKRSKKKEIPFIDQFISLCNKLLNYYEKCIMDSVVREKKRQCQQLKSQIQSIYQLGENYQGRSFQNLQQI